MKKIDNHTSSGIAEIDQYNVTGSRPLQTQDMVNYLRPNHDDLSLDSNFYVLQLNYLMAVMRKGEGEKIWGL